MDDATMAAWSSEGLPSDRMSLENAAILANCERWPLMIDPQQQGIEWVRNWSGPDLRVVQQGQKGFDFFRPVWMFNVLFFSFYSLCFRSNITFRWNTWKKSDVNI